MESFVERLFRETYELDDIPDPRVGSPYPVPPSELLSLSSPLVEPAHEGGGNLGWFDCDLHTWSQGTQAAHDPHLDMPNTSREPTNPGDNDLDRARRCSPARCGRCGLHHNDGFRSGENPPPCTATASICDTLVTGSGLERSRTLPYQLPERSRGAYQSPNAELPSQSRLRCLDPSIPHPASLEVNGLEPQTVHISITQHRPNDPNHILKLVKKTVGGKATCLWPRESNDECGFSSQVDLVKRHIKRVHYRLRPHSCRYCSRKFFSKYTLSIHNNSHTGEKPFPCDFCDRGFSTPSGRSRHRIRVH